LGATAAIACAAFVAGCAAEAPVGAASDAAGPGTAAAIAASAAPVPVAPQEARQIVVEEGRSISRIAAKYGVSESAIIAANHLPPPYKIKTGQRLVVPSPDAGPQAMKPQTRHIVVEEGQSISRIAAKYHVPESTIITANRLSAPYKLNIGQRLLLPSPSAVVGPPAAETISLDGPGPPPPATALPKPQAEPIPSAAPAAISPAPLQAETGPSPMPVAAPAGPPQPAAAPPAGVTCPPGTTGAWTVDIIKAPVYVCR
jgi:LysM repeat protein